MLSSMHLDGSISDQSEDNSKSKTVLFCNIAKTTVDSRRNVCNLLIVTKIRLQSLELFFQPIDLTGINDQIVFATNNRKNKLVQRKFLDVEISLRQSQLKK